MDMLLHFLGRTFHELWISYYCHCTYHTSCTNATNVYPSENIHIMRGKTQVVKPEIEKLQDKLKNADTQEERTAANKLLMKSTTTMVLIHSKA